MHRHPSHTVVALCAIVAAGACSPGGSGNTAPGWTEVSFSASNHVFFFHTAGWTSVPVSPQQVWAGCCRLQMFSDGMYTFTDANGQNGSSTRRYSLEDAGFLTLDQSTFPGVPSDYGIGGVYSRVGASDRRSPGSTPDLFLQGVLVAAGQVQGTGSYLGTRVVPGPVELAGDWHLLSLHVILEQTAPSPDSVGRGARGNISIASGAPGTLRSISGSGSLGTSSVTYAGTFQNRLDHGGDGTCNLTVSYQLGGQTADDRVMLAAARSDTVFGLDANASDGEVGQLFLVRKFDVPTPVDPARVPGRFPCAGRMLVVNPANGRALQFRGVITLTASGDFTLEADPPGIYFPPFIFAGSRTLAPDGGLTLSASDGGPGGPETWFAAIDRGYNTLVFVDDFVETGSTPRLHLGFAVREKAPD